MEGTWRDLRKPVSFLTACWYWDTETREEGGAFRGGAGDLDMFITPCYTNILLSDFL